MPADPKRSRPVVKDYSLPHISIPSPAEQVHISTDSQASSPLESTHSTSASRSNHFGANRVFPRPPVDVGTASPTIRPGSVRSVTVDRSEDARSIHSFKGSITDSLPPVPDIPASIDPAMTPSTAASPAPATGQQSDPPVATNGGAAPKSSSSGSKLAPPTRRQASAARAAAAAGGTTSSHGHSSFGRSASSHSHSAAHHNADSDLNESTDRVGNLSSVIDGMGVIGSFDKRLNRSVMSLGAKAKAEKVLGPDPQPRLASLYLVSGLGKDPAQWALSDSDTTIGIQPIEDSLGVFWRPDMLGSTFSGEKTDEYGHRHAKSSMRSMSSGMRRELGSKTVPGTGPEGASRLVSRTMKYAHPKDIEVVNSTLPPATTCHTFTFSVSRQSTLTATAAQASRKGSSRTGVDYEQFTSVTTEAPSAKVGVGQEHLRGTTHSSDLVFYGVTLCVWSHADKDRAAKLKQFKQHTAGRTRANSILSEITTQEKTRKRRSKTPWLKRVGVATSDFSAATDPEATGDSDMETTYTDAVDSSVAEVPGFGESSDVFWLPYALTLVSRYPIYDVMQDYLRLSWARYSKDARAHMRTVCAFLNSEAPRPGDLFRLPIGANPDDEVIIEATMPGALDFEKGTLKVDFQMWPIFQALDIDHLITCVEIALSPSGRIIFCSRHPAMLGSAVNTLRYIVELRGWNGVSLPNIHTRDATFIVEDPGPYIIGMPTEGRYVIAPPSEVAIVDLDMNTLTCKTPPVGAISSRQKRDKARHKLMAALGPNYPSEKSVPKDYRETFFKGSFRNINRVQHGPARPRYLGERLHPPQWWNQSAAIAVLDRIMADKHKKPSLFQRLFKSEIAPEHLTANEMLAKAMMRKRALHYVEKRDDFELKFARITRRLQKLVQECEHWRQRFELFEKYAERLAQEANDLKVKIDREQREARRLSNINSEQNKQNAELEAKLKQTENARAEAMRQLSDVHQMIQELERERDMIMDAIDMQVSNVLGGIAGSDDSHSRWSSPEPVSSASHHYHGREDRHRSPPSSPPMTASTTGTVKAKHRGRPTTSDSTFTVDSSVSIIGAIKGATGAGVVRPSGGTSIFDADQLSTADKLLSSSKTDGLAQRVAHIQAKLELALGPARGRKDGSDNSHGSDDGGLPVIVEPRTPEPIVLAKGKLSGKLSADGISPVPSGSSSDFRPADGADSDFTPVPDTDHQSEHEQVIERMMAHPHSYRPVVLRPPPRRITQKPSYDSIDSAASLDTQRHMLNRVNSVGRRSKVLIPLQLSSKAQPATKRHSLPAHLPSSAASAINALRDTHTNSSTLEAKLAARASAPAPPSASAAALAASLRTAAGTGDLSPARPESEILLTPRSTMGYDSPSNTKNKSAELDDGRPSSVLSTTTVTFGVRS